MQKKVLAAIAAMAVGTSAAMAATLSPEEALARIYGNEGAGSRPARAMAIARENPQLIKTIETADGKPAAYLFGSAEAMGPVASAEGAWILAGADDKAAPLLGYGTGKADPEKMPPQMKWWLEEYAAQIAAANEQTTTPAYVKMQGEESSAAKVGSKITTKGSVGPLLTTTWDQLDPYNLYTPLYGESHTPTGCVATAMAQVMNYFEYPAKGKGTGSVTYNGETLTRSLEVEFDWAKMKDNYMYSASTTEEKEAVAELMVSCGYAVNMQYSPGGSGAMDQDMLKALIDNFSYDQGAWLYERDNYSLEEWEQMLIDNLTNVGPMYYSGQAPDGGHAFVCDGYDGKGLFHFNWGWNGFYDGYFAIDALNPEGQGTGGYDGGYNTLQAAVMGIQRPVEGSKRPQVQLTQFGDVTATLSGNSITLTTSGLNGYAGWYNMSYASATLYFGLELEETTSGTKQMAVTGTRGNSLGSYYGNQTVTMTIPSTVADGTYRARLMTREDGYDAWMPALVANGSKKYVVIEMTDGEPAIGQEPSEEFEIQQAAFNGELISGQPGSYTATIYNGTAATVSQKVGVALIDYQGYVMALSSTSTTFTVESKKSIERTVEFTLDYQYGFLANTDYIGVLYDPDTNKILYNFGTVQVVDESTQQPSIVTSMVLTPLYYGKQSTYGFTLKNPTKKDLDYNVTVALIDDQYGVYAMDDKTNAIHVGAGTTETFSFPFNFTYYSSSFELDKEYYFVIIDVSDEGMTLIDVVDAVSVTRDPDDPTAEMTCHSFTLEGDNSAAEMSSLHFIAEVSASADVTDYLLLAIWDGKTGEVIGAVKTDPVDYEKDVHQPVHVYLDFSKATPGAKYIAAILDSREKQISDDLYFTAKDSSGLEDATVDAKLSLNMNTATRTAIALSGAEITDVKVYSPSGALLNAPAEISGNSARIDLEGLSGMVIVTVTDASGEQVSKKAMLK